MKEIKTLGGDGFTFTRDSPVAFTSHCTLTGTATPGIPVHSEPEKCVEYIHDEEIYEFCKEVGITEDVHQENNKRQVGGINQASRESSEKVQNGQINCSFRVIQKKPSLRCDICQKEYKSVQAMERHMNFHKDEKPYTCPHCHMRFRCTSNIARHIKYKHRSEAQHRCTKCDYSCVEAYRLKQHIKTHNEIREFNCTKCDYTAKRRDCLSMHMKVHTREKPHKCNTCSESFTQLVQLQRHITKNHEDSVFKCSECPSKFFSRSKFDDHVTLHRNKMAYHCTSCNTVYKSQHKFKGHEKTCLSTYTCKTCPYTTTRLTNLNKHTETQHNTGPVSCKVCMQEFPDKYAMNQHICAIEDTSGIKVASGLKVICNYCDRRFQRYKQLKEHIKNKHPDRLNIKCDHCDYVTWCQTYMRAHASRSHRKFNCEFCTFSSWFKKKLATHRKLQHAEELMEIGEECDTDSDNAKCKSDGEKRKTQNETTENDIEMSDQHKTTFNGRHDIEKVQEIDSKERKNDCSKRDDKNDDRWDIFFEVKPREYHINENKDHCACVNNISEVKNCCVNEQSENKTADKCISQSAVDKDKTIIDLTEVNKRSPAENDVSSAPSDLTEVNKISPAENDVSSALSDVTESSPAENDASSALSDVSTTVKDVNEEGNNRETTLSGFTTDTLSNLSHNSQRASSCEVANDTHRSKLDDAQNNILIDTYSSISIDTYNSISSETYNSMSTDTSSSYTHVNGVDICESSNNTENTESPSQVDEQHAQQTHCETNYKQQDEYETDYKQQNGCETTNQRQTGCETDYKQHTEFETNYKQQAENPQQIECETNYKQQSESETDYTHHTECETNYKQQTENLQQTKCETDYKQQADNQLQNRVFVIYLDDFDSGAKFITEKVKHLHNNSGILIKIVDRKENNATISENTDPEVKKIAGHKTSSPEIDGIREIGRILNENFTLADSKKISNFENEGNFENEENINTLQPFLIGTP